MRRSRRISSLRFAYLVQISKGEDKAGQLRGQKLKKLGLSTTGPLCCRDQTSVPTMRFVSSRPAMEAATSFKSLQLAGALGVAISPAKAVNQHLKSRDDALLAIAVIGALIGVIEGTFKTLLR